MMLFSIICFAQDEDEKDLPEVDENYEKYLKDGVHHDAGNYASISLSEVIGGFINFHYERRVTNIFSLDAGIAKPIHRGLDPIEMLFNEEVQSTINLQEDKPGGIGYSFSVRANPGRRAVAYYGYYSFNYRYRMLKYENVDYSRKDYYFGTGWKQLYNNNIGLEVVQGIGARTSKLTDKSGNPSLYTDLYNPVSSFFYYIDFKVGYFF